MTIRDLQKTMDKDTVVFVSEFNGKYQNDFFELHNAYPDNEIASIKVDGVMWRGEPILTLELIDPYA